MITITIDPEFRDLIKPLTDEERANLETSMLVNGYDSAYPIILWKHDGKDILIDGHHRFAASTKLGIEPKTTYHEFDTREEVIDWMIDNQLSRRNIDKEYRDYLIGKKYNKVKKTHGGARGNSCTLKTDEKIAKEYDISPRTVKSNGAYYEMVERICLVCGANKQEVMLKISKKGIIGMSKFSDLELQNAYKDLINEVPIAKSVSIYPVLLKLDKETNKMLKELSGGNLSEYMINLIKSEWERRND